MTLNIQAENRWKAGKGIFDMAALCYDSVVECLEGMSESVFIAQYFDRGENCEKNNPNIETLRRLTNDVKAILNREVIPIDRIECTWDCMQKTADKMCDFENEKCNLASIYLAVLRGIDLHVFHKRRTGSAYSTDGPLNTADNYKSLVYMKPADSLLDEQKETYKYRLEVSSGGVSDILKAIILIRKSDLIPECGYPAVKNLRIHDGRSELRKKLEREHILRIAIFPEGKPQYFEFDKTSTPGSSFCVRYPDTQNMVIRQHCMWLKKAIEAGANLIVFPEFFVGPKILDGMICFLRENADNDWLKSSSLLAVLAGTTWTNDHNNVMHILDMRGELVGTYYKYSPFSHSPSDGEDNAAYKDCEYLSTPGKNITLVDIDGVGRILPSICRDIIDGELTERLVKNFDTFLLVTSAYSPSVASFKRHYNNYASCHYVTSVLCNACIAVEKGSSLGICTVPMKKGSEMYYYSKTISKCRNWKKDCPDSCCIMLELNYGVETRAKQSMHPEISCRRSK